MIWAGHPPTCVQWAHRTPLAAGAGTKPMENTTCTTATRVQLANSHFRCKAVQIIPSSVTDCSRATRTPWSNRRGVSRKGQHPTMCLDRIRVCLGNITVLLPLCPPAKQGHRAECQLPADTAPCPGGAPAQSLIHALQWSCSHSSLFPAQESAHREERAPLSSLGASGRGALSLTKGAWALLKMETCFLKCFMPKGTFAVDTLPCTGPKPLRRNLLGKTGERLSACHCWDGRQQEMLPTKLRAQLLTRHCWEWHFCVQCECTAHGESTGVGWSHCPICGTAVSSGFFRCCQKSHVLSSSAGTLVFCCLSFPCSATTGPLILFAWSPPPSSFSLTVDIFCSFCPLFPMIWAQQCFAHTVQQEFSAFLIMFRGLQASPSPCRLWDRVLLCTVFFITWMKKQSSASHSPGCEEPSLHGLMPFPPDVGEAGRQEVFFSCVICVHLRHCSQAGLGWVLGLKLSLLTSQGFRVLRATSPHSSSANSEGSPNRQNHPINICLMSYSPGSWTHVFVLLVEYTCKLNIVW